MSDGKGCKCGAWNQGECDCDADWTPQIVYDQQSRIAQLAALIRDVAIPELEDDGARRHCPEREEALTKLRDGINVELTGAARLYRAASSGTKWSEVERRVGGHGFFPTEGT